MRRLPAIAIAVALPVGFVAAASWEAQADDDPFGPAPSGTPIRPADPARPPARPSPAGSEQDAPIDVAAFRPWLSHEDWLCRALAAGELARRSDDGAVRFLTFAAAKEADVRALSVMLRALVGRPRNDLLVEGGVDLGDRLVPLLRHAHPSIRARALAILKALTPVRLGDDPDAYLLWWDKGREGLALEAKLATERRRAVPSSSPARAPGEPHTVVAASMRRYENLDRIHRHGLEVVICLDSTGSMVGVIESAKRNLAALIDRLRTLAPRLRVGLVTYDDEARLRSPLTTDEKALEREFRRVVASGGEDYEEGVDKAVALALRQDRVAWSGKASRVIVVVGDAPPTTRTSRRCSGAWPAPVGTVPSSPPSASTRSAPIQRGPATPRVSSRTFARSRPAARAPR